MISLLAAQLLNGLAIGMIYALTAFGLSIIKGLLNVPNFAHGAFYALGAYICFAAMQVGMPFGLALLTAFVAPALVGIVVEKLGVARLMSGPYLYQLLFLFGTALVLEQLIIIIWGTVGLSVQPPEFLQGAFDLGIHLASQVPGVQRRHGRADHRRGLAADRAHPPGVADTGRHRQTRNGAVPGDRRVPPGDRRVRPGLGLAGLPGGLVLPLLGANATMGSDMLSIAFVVLVIGGLGSLYGALAAGILVGIIQSVSSVFVPSASTVLIYVAMVATLMIRPQGLFGER